MLLYGANSPFNESSEELKMEQWCLYFHSSFSLFQDYSINAEIDLELPPFIFAGRTKIKRTISSNGKRPTTQLQVVAGKPG